MCHTRVDNQSLLTEYAANLAAVKNTVTTRDLEILEAINLESEKCSEKCEWCEDDGNDGKPDDSGAHDKAAMRVSDTSVRALQV